MGVIPMGPPDERSGPEGPPRVTAAKQGTTEIIADRQHQARRRILAQDEHRRICRELEQLGPLVVWYRQPKGAFYCLVVEGRWAA
jgi:hypothetical protein